MKLDALLRISSSIVALLAGAVAPLTRGHAQSAGSVGAVNPSATGTPPGGAARTLAIGTSVVRNERLQTSAAGSLHVTLSDRTTLNLGPSTTLVIDSYAYNPASGSGGLKASIRSGLLRFVGGQTSHQGAATIQTPVATIGIRGDMVLIQFDPTCGWRVTSLAQGVITVRNNVSEVQIQRPGFTVCVASANTAIPVPTRASPANIQQAFAATISQRGQTGGAKTLPTAAQMSRLLPKTNTAPISSFGPSPLGYLSIFSIQPGAGRNAAQPMQVQRALSRGTAVPPPQSQNPYGTSP